MGSCVENVLLVVIDALRADRVGTYHDDTTERSLTPTLDALADDGEVFERCYACVNATDSSLTTIMTGLYPTRHGIISHGKNVTDTERERVATTQPLPQLLNETHATIGIDRLGRWHERGFDAYGASSLSRGRLGTTAVAAWEQLPGRVKAPFRIGWRAIRGERTPYPMANTVTDAVLGAIERADGPWFTLAHYWDTHIPYDSPGSPPAWVRNRAYADGDVPLAEVLAPIAGSEWATELDDLLGDAETVGDVKRKYDTSVWAVDNQLRRLIGTLQNRGQYENTAIVVTADHGENFTDHGILFDHHGLYEPTVHVPLLINAPGFDGQERQFVQHFDLVPTVLDMLGESFDTDQFDGQSLCPRSGERTLNRDGAYFEEGNTARRRGLRTDAAKYIIRLDDRNQCRYCDVRHAADVECFDMLEDPQETTNIADEQPTRVADFGARLQSWIDTIPEPDAGAVTFEESDEALERLEDLGYI
jgi:arylsulfatase A-like enzyme